VVRISRRGFCLEDIIQVVLTFHKDFRKDECKKSGQLLKIVLKWGSGEQELESGRDPDQSLVSLRIQVFQIVAFVTASHSQYYYFVSNVGGWMSQEQSDKERIPYYTHTYRRLVKVYINMGRNLHQVSGASRTYYLPSSQRDRMLSR